MSIPGRTVAFVITLLVVAAVPAPSAAGRAAKLSRPIVTATAAILLDNQTGVVLWQHNPDLPLPPASTTKIVTAMLALQSGRLDEPFVVTKTASKAPPSKISLRPGWRMRLRDLVYAILLNSANDASVVIAQGISGSVRDFAARMNAHARALGATRSNFVNPNGLPADNHYSTARDLALMFSQAMQDPEFMEIVSTKARSVSPLNSSRTIRLQSKNRLLADYRIRVVGKTGWTRAAKKCFVGAGMADGREIVIAILGSNDLWGDVKRLLEFGFDANAVPVAQAELRQAKSAAKAEIDESEGAGDIAESAPGARYYIQLATFRSIDRATRLKDSLAGRGYPVRIAEVRQGRRRYYRVSAGGYARRHEAMQAAQRIEKIHPDLKTIIVDRS